MSIRIIPRHMQASGAFNRGQILENKPIGFPGDGGHVRPYSNLFYWARAEAVVDSTIGLHPHQGFEIMSFVLEGRIRHYDTAHDTWIPLKSGDVQIIRAGSGIQHAEHMEKGAVMFQIWTDPDLSKTLQQPASYNDYPAEDFPVISGNGHQRITLIGEGSPLVLDTQPLEVSRIRFEGSLALQKDPSHTISLYIIDGTGMVEDQGFGKDDFMIMEDGVAMYLMGNGPVDLFCIDSPRDVGYPTYAQRLMR